MKNLKKVLSMALALVMMLGMMTVATAVDTAKKTAKDLTDMDKVVNKAAVTLLVDLGVIAGKEDGTFAPAEGINRASFAKMAFYAITGSDDADAYLGTATGLKDIKGNWAEAFISYLASVKIVTGDENGNYKPDADVSVAEAAKVMLTGMGYNAEDRGYVGEGWSGSIMADAKNFGLMKGISQGALEVLTRDNAAQMIYNALAAQSVTAVYGRDNGEKYVTGYTKGNPLGYNSFSLIKLTAMVSEIDASGNAVLDKVAAGDAVISNVNKVNGKIAASLNAVGQEVTIFVKGEAIFKEFTIKATDITIDSVVSTALAAGSSELIATVTKGGEDTLVNTFTKGADGFKATLAMNDDKSYAASLYLNGKEVTPEGTIKDMKTFLADIAAAAAKKGTVIELYSTNNDGVANIVKVYNYTVMKVTGDVTTKTVKDELQVTVPGVVTKSTPATQVTGYQGLVKGDYVLVYTTTTTTDSITLTNITKADSVTGTVTGTTSGGEVKVNGTNYGTSGQTGSGFKALPEKWDDFDNEYTFYLDKNGSVVNYVQNTNEASSSKVALVLASTWVTGDGSLNNSQFMQAKILFVDGTTEIVKVAKVGGKTVVAKDAKLGTDEVNYSEDLTEKTTVGFMSYTVNSKGNYELTALTEKKQDDDTTPANTLKTFSTDTEIVKKPAFAGSVAVANANTMFIVEKGTDKGDKTYTVYTGFANVPAMTAKNGVINVVVKTAVANYVFLSTEAYSDDTPEGFIFLTSADYSYDKAADQNTYSIINADGTENEAAAFSTDLVLKDVGLYQVLSVADGKITKVLKVDAVKLNSIGGSVINVNGKIYSYDTDTVFVLITMENEKTYDTADVFDPEALSMDTDAYTYTVKVSGNDTKGEAAYVYVVRTPVTTPAS